MTSPIINCGRHRGQAVVDLPEHYIRWRVDPGRGKPEADQPSRPIPPKILSAAHDQLDFIEQEKLRELFAQRCLGGHPTGIDTPIFIIECEGDCHSKSGSFAIDEKWFPSLEESLAFLAAEFPIIEKNDFGGPSGKLIRSTPDPEDDKILLWEVLPTGHRKVVWGFFGWHHSSSSDIYACGQSSLPEIGRASCRERVCQYV